jgi:hypothetical protein
LTTTIAAPPTPPPPAPRRPRRLAAVAAAAGIVALAATGVVLGITLTGDDERSADTTPTTQPPATETTSEPVTTTGITDHTIPTLIEVDPSDPNADLLIAFERAKRALLEANALGDPNYPPLVETSQGEALQLARSSIEALRSQGQRALFEGRIARLQVVERGASTATVQACAVDRGRLVDIDTGQRLDDGSVTVNAVTDVMVLVGDTWKLDHSLPADLAICEGVTP